MAGLEVLREGGRLVSDGAACNVEQGSGGTKQAARVVALSAKVTLANRQKGKTKGCRRTCWGEERGVGVVLPA